MQIKQVMTRGVEVVRPDETLQDAEETDAKTSGRVLERVSEPSAPARRPRRDS
jgi:hypothetical protein